jgi:hypothetical protein
MSTDQMTAHPSDRALFLAPKIRRHFGELFRWEPSITFIADGSVIVLSAITQGN